MNMNLKEMEGSQLCDVLHFFFEQDARYSSAEEVQSVSDMRSRLYGLYNKTYKYASKSSDAQGRSYLNPQADFDMDLPMDFNNMPTKNYIPPTDFNGQSSMPFGDILDPPVGG